LGAGRAGGSGRSRVAGVSLGPLGAGLARDAIQRLERIRHGIQRLPGRQDCEGRCTAHRAHADLQPARIAGEGRGAEINGRRENALGHRDRGVGAGEPDLGARGGGIMEGETELVVAAGGRAGVVESPLVAEGGAESCRVSLRRSDRGGKQQEEQPEQMPVDGKTVPTGQPMRTCGNP